MDEFVEPLGMRVLIRKDESRQRTRGGIVLPDQAEIPTITGRVVEVSSAAMRLVLSGTLERHPDLKLVMSHTGGMLPYQSGRMDKNTKGAKLPKPASHYIRNMYTDTVSPHSAGMRFAIDFYGIDNVMYGTDYPCWLPAECLAYIEELKLGAEEQRKLFFDNAVRILNLPADVGAWCDAERAAAE